MASARGRAPLVLVGTTIIAVCYGLGRYAFGLFVPELADGLGLSPTAIGIVGGLSHVGYGAGLVAAPMTARRHEPIRVASGAALVAAVGLAGVAASVGPVTLGLGVLVAGSGSGLASPTLALAVTRRLAPTQRSAAQTWINSGTSLGLAVSAPTILLAFGWRVAWAGFAAVAALVAIAARASVRPAVRSRVDGASGTQHAVTRPVGMGRLRLLGHCGALGMTSAVYWTFSRHQVLAGGVSEEWSVAFWLAIGAFGLLGGSAGALADRRGLATALRTWGLVWIGALAALSLPTIPTMLALASAAGFGAAYMALTGLVILWAIEVDGDAAMGVRACFLALGLAQAVGTPIAGAIADAFGLPASFAIAAAASVVLLVAVPLRGHAVPALTPAPACGST